MCETGVTGLHDFHVGVLAIAISLRSRVHLSNNLRSGVPLVFVGSGKERLIQLLDNSSVASPQSGLFSDWSRNKRVLRTKP